MKQDPGWWTVVELLEKHGVGYRSLKATRGSNAEMFHVEFPPRVDHGCGETGAGVATIGESVLGRIEWDLITNVLSTAPTMGRFVNRR